MEMYYNDGLSAKTREIGARNKFNKYHIGKYTRRFLKWYFNDKFGVTINVLGLLLMVI